MSYTIDDVVSRLDKLIQILQCDVDLKVASDLESSKSEYKNSYTLFGWLEEWFSIYKLPKLKKSSCDEIRVCIDKHIRKNMKDINLDKLTGLDIQKALNKITSSRTKKYTYNVFNNSLKQALKLGVMKNDVMLSVESVQHKYKIGQALTKQQQENFLKIISGNKLELLYKFYVLSGCRRSEAVSLKWSDVDFRNKIIHICGTKTNGSDRLLPLFPAIDKVLQMLPKKSDMVFCTTVDAVKSNFKRLKIKYNLPYTLHDLRHTFATRCLENGISMKTIQHWLGHSRLETTANIYTHVQTDFERCEIMKYDIKM